ncbi:carbon-nitrogen hydrolase family protein [Chitinasiproducens palmae]|uniref:Nitrilase n=1 Tax=Chitinasiproducens palmae TaxID=1770053 RepID=A0A1H2PRJ7_9BURK|nr:carbon-nitrogen hydrolase family protein [Chitinasiproducens palmae]SDV49469.1 nitrilase [Chitinasiproducens palmae]
MNPTAVSASPDATRVAAIQMVSGVSPERNLDRARELIADAAAGGAGFVLLPEYFCLMGNKDTDKLARAEIAGDEQAPIQRMLAESARAHGIWLAGGTLPVVSGEDGRVLNTTFVYDPEGRGVARYDKIHLFSFSKGEEQFDEARTIRPGEQACVFDAPFGRVGLSVCYDLRFPELYRSFGDCALIVVPSAFTYTTGRAHWEILLRARAIENQCYVLAAAQGGRHENGRRTWGHSMLIDPWGEIVACHEEGEGIALGAIEPARLAEVRQNLPALRHRVLG